VTSKKRAPRTARATNAPKKTRGKKQSVQARNEQALALMSDLMGRYRLAKRAGLQYGGRRDIYEVAGYVTEGQIEFEHYFSIYERGDIGGRIVEMPAKTTWRTPPEISEDDEPDGTEFTETLDALAKRIRLWHHFQLLDIAAGIGRYGVLLIGVRGASAQTLRTPLTRIPGPDSVLYLKAYNEREAAIEQFDMNPSSAQYLRPLLYKITTSDGISGVGKSQLVVHHSRVIHAAENSFDGVFGRPRLKRVLNRLFDLDKVAASTAEAYWQSVARILQAQIDADATSPSAEEIADLRDQMSEMIHDLRRQFIGKGTKLEWLSMETPNAGQVVDMYFSLIAGAAGIPKRILFGSELGELASTTDEATYFGAINERQEHFAEPDILRAFVDRMITIGGLPQPKTGEYQVSWPPLFEESEKELAEADKIRAEAVKALTPVGGDPTLLVEIDENRRIWPVPLPPLADRPEDEPSPFSDMLEKQAEAEVDAAGDGDEPPDGERPVPPDGGDDGDGGEDADGASIAGADEGAQE